MVSINLRQSKRSSNSSSALTLLVRSRARFQDAARNSGDPICAATDTFEIDFAALGRQILRTRFLHFQISLENFEKLAMRVDSTHGAIRQIGQSKS